MNTVKTRSESKRTSKKKQQGVQKNKTHKGVHQQEREIKQYNLIICKQEFQKKKNKEIIEKLEETAPD